MIVSGAVFVACETAPGESGCPGGDCGEGGGPNGCGRDEYSVHGDCRQLTECSPSQYQLIAPTASSDRVCDALTTCRSSQYERKAPTATSDRECKSLTECRRHSQYESAAPTSTSDRECSTLTTCGRDEYETQPPTDTTDRGCSKVTVCEESEYEAKAPTATTDRVCEPNLPCPPSSYRFGAACRPLTECKSYEFESAPATATSDRVCTRVTECTGGQQEIEPPTATTDRVCGETGPCAYGYYESAPATATRDRECKLITTCTAQQYEVQAPTATSNRICAGLTMCREGQYESVAPTATSNRVCTVITTCTASEYELTSPTPTSDRECAALTICTSAEYQTVPPTATSDRQCQVLTVCTPKQFQSVPPTATSDRQCKALTQCKEYEYESVPPTATSDRVCACYDYDGDDICDPFDDACTLEGPSSTTVQIDPTCLAPDVIVDDPWSLVVEQFIPSAGGLGSASMPIVANLDDDNDDSVIDDRDMPELVFTEIGAVFAANPPSFLVARRLDGSELFRFSGTDGLSTPLVADIDQDGSPEIVIRLATGFVVALSADAQTVEWTTSFATSNIYGVTPTVGDLDGDGDLEVVVEGGTGQFGASNVVYALDGATGELLWENTFGGTLSIPIVADLDRDGSAEVIFGSNIYSGDGVALTDNNVTETVRFNSVINVDGDADGEVISVTAGAVWIYDSNGSPLDLWTYPIPQGNPGPPCVADFDGDGGPEIAIPSSTILQVYELDGEPVWDDNATISDLSGIAGCSGYDADGDGDYEVLFGDENTFWMFDGGTGDVLFEESAHSSGTLWEYPTIADYDKDGSAEVLIASNLIVSGDEDVRAGIVVFGHADDGWARAGTTWGIHDYAPGKIGADNTVSLDRTQPWQIHNVYRARPNVDTAATDLRIALVDTCAAACRGDATTNVGFQVSNYGASPVPAGVIVGLYYYDYWNEGYMLLDWLELDEAVAGGGSVSGAFTGVLDSFYGELALVVDPEGDVGECNSANNIFEFGFYECDGGGPN